MAEQSDSDSARKFHIDETGSILRALQDSHERDRAQLQNLRDENVRLRQLAGSRVHFEDGGNIVLKDGDDPLYAQHDPEHAVKLQPDQPAASSNGHGNHEAQPGVLLKKRISLRKNLSANSSGSDMVQWETKSARSSTSSIRSRSGLRPNWLAATCKRIIQADYFEYGMGTIILFNSILLGAETDMRAQGSSPAWMDVAENVFLIIYIVELVIRFLAKGRANFKDNWVNFDILLVTTGVVTYWILPFIVHTDAGTKHAVTLVRAFRLLRFARALRVIKSLGVMWKLVFGVLKSWNTMLSTLGLLILCLYIFACIGVELISRDEHLQNAFREDSFLDDNFGSVYLAMVALMQFVTLDGLAELYGPIIRVRPWLWLYFLPVIVLVSISLMNLVTAVLVEHAMEMAANDSAEKRRILKQKVKELVPKIEMVFNEIDTDSSGSIDVNEISRVQPSHFPIELQDLLRTESLEELFLMLDVDQSGTVDKDEFVDGVLNLVLAEVPKEMLVVLKIVTLQHERSMQLERALNKMQVVTEDLQNFSHLSFGELRNLTGRKDNNISDVGLEAEGRSRALSAEREISGSSAASWPWRL